MNKYITSRLKKIFKGIGGGKTLFSQLDFILKSFIQAT